MVDAADLKSAGAKPREGSTPSLGTTDSMDSLHEAPGRCGPGGCLRPFSDCHMVDPKSKT